MPDLLKRYVRIVDAVNHAIGRVAMWLIFVLGGILLWSTLSRLVLGSPVNWALEMSQFLMSAYYLIGGAYSVQLRSHVRMDLLYDRLSARRRAATDVVTVLFVIFYLCILMWGGISSTGYAIEYGQTNYTAWAPPLWPIKLAMTIGIFMMLLQMISTLIKDLAIARGTPIS